MVSHRLTAVFAVAALAVLPALAACGKGKNDSGSAAGSKVGVRATDTACEVERTALQAGSTTFTVSNKGAKTTEVYVYGAAGGAFTKVVGEVENIGPGTSRDMKVDLTAGSYEIACKPGQKGDGIRTGIIVSGEGGAVVRAADREVEFSAFDFAYDGLSALTVKSGETIKFEMENKGPAEHEFEVLAPDGKAVGEIGPTKGGAAGDITLTLARAGTYTYVCGLSDHEARGMKGTFTVG